MSLVKNWPVVVNAMAGAVLTAIVVLQLAGPAGREGDQAPAYVAQGPGDVTEARILQADREPGSWLAHGRTYDEQRFSPLTQINDRNIGELGLAWTYETGTTRGLEATPIVVDGVMYISLNWGVTVAVDARSGAEIWRFDPEVPGEWARYACCDVVNRGVAVWKGKVYVASIDGRLFALNARDGSKIWEVNTVPGPPYTITGAVRVVKDKVIIGNGGAEYGVRGFFSAYDAETGKLVWRFYTVPGDPSKPAESKAIEQALPTWKGGEWWKYGGGGTAWDSMVYDPALNTLYVGTGNGSPWSRVIRSPGGGDNLYLCSIVAVDPDTGELKWHYQETPSEKWDYTATQPLMLADLVIDGQKRKTLLHAPKNGFFYVLDRETGKLISAKNFVTVTWASHVDLETGRPVETGIGDYEEKSALVFPSGAGGHNWHPMAYNPQTGLVYIPAQDMPQTYTIVEEWKQKKNFTYTQRAWNTSLNWQAFVDVLKTAPPSEPPAGFLKAWDPVKQELRWEVKLSQPLNGGVVTTAGNLVFQGTANGWFSAYRADTGEKIWERNIQTGIIAAPISYMVDGVQYISILAGAGGAAVGGGDISRVSAKYGNNGRLLVFKLGGKMELPKLAVLDQSIPEWPVLTATPAQIREGEVLYHERCQFCHGTMVISGGVLPDLRRMNENTRKHFQDIVRGGMLKDNGMASFADILSEEQADRILNYIQSRALEDRKREQPTN